MLVGEDINGEKISLATLTRESCQKLKTTTWYCPSCKSKLSLKIGATTIPHFAHYSIQDCSTFSENESEEHLTGKSQIARWCQNNHIQYEVEAYLPEINQRPDILIENNIAIEFQCSPLSISRLVERTNNYLNHNYKVIWLLGKNLHLKNKVTSIQRSVMFYSNQLGVYLFQLNVKLNQVVLCHHVEEIAWLKTVKYKKRLFNLDSPIERWFEPSRLSYVLSRRSYATKVIINQQKIKLNQSLFYREKKTLEIQAILYKEGMSLQTMSCLFFLDVREIICSSSLYLEFKLDFWKCIMNVNGKVIKSELFLFFNNWFYSHQLTMYEMPLFHTEKYLFDLFSSYLHQLLINNCLTIHREETCTLLDLNAYFLLKLPSTIQRQISALPIQNVLE